MRQQFPLLRLFVIAVIVGFALDAFVRGPGAAWADSLGIGDPLRDAFTLPSEGTLRNVLAASAAGTATILGLVLSISLIAWQATADHYRSTSIVAFLLRDRTGTAVVRLLALGFAYSLWVLALLEVFGHPLYVSSFLALAICTAAVLSLISYRQVGLLGYLPGRIAESLRSDLIREIKRGSRRGAGPSVANASRQLVAADVRIFRDLLNRVSRDGDSADLAACVQELGNALLYYVVNKRKFSPTSLFFERREERLQAGGFGIEERIVSEGLMTPTQEVPDHLWLERSILTCIAKLAASDAVRNPEVAKSIFRVWAGTLQYAWHLEDSDLLEAILLEIEATSENSAWRETRETAEEIQLLPWLLVEAVSTGPTTTAESIVATEPWKGDDQFGDLPWAAREDARELGVRVRNEIGIAGKIVTPQRKLQGEVQERRDARLGQLRAEMISRALSIHESHLARAVGEDSPAASAVGRMALRTVLRIVHHDLPVPDLTDLTSYVARSASTGDTVEREDIRLDAGRAARALAAHSQWEASLACLQLCAYQGLISQNQISDATKTMALISDTAYTVATIYAWSEYHQHDILKEISRYIQTPYANFNAFKEMSDEHRLNQVMFPSHEHYTWLQGVSTVIHNLPEVPFRDGGIGFNLKKDHPSRLIQRASMHFGPRDCLNALIDATAEMRRSEAEQLAAILSAWLAKREGEDG